MKVRFWGVRGSIPSPGPETVRTGGNTSCIEIVRPGEPIILDAGTGIRAPGLRLARKDSGPHRIHLLLSHTHWDHIQGFPFFSPLHQAGRKIVVYGPRGLERGLEETLLAQLQRTYFPIRRSEIRAQLSFRETGEERFEIDGLEVETLWMNHPVLSLAFSLRRGRRRIVYTGDHEPFTYIHVYAPDAPGNIRVSVSEEERIRRRKRLVGFLKGSDVLITDAQYTDEEYRSQRIGWGHSPLSYAVDLAAEAGVRTLVLFHHDPAADDSRLDEQLERARTLMLKHGAPCRVRLAREGEEIDAAEV